MQPLKITIWGDFWDCQIYMGRLYLWTMNGVLKVFKWENIIDSLIDRTEDRLALYCGFTRGNYLYDESLEFIFEDPQFKSMLFKKFRSVSDKKYELSLNEIQKHLYGEQDNPFDEFPTDTEIVNKKLYSTTENGLWVTDAHRYSKKKPVKTRPNRIWDCPLLSIKANKYSQIALSAGEDGLYEYNANYLSQKYTSVLPQVEKGVSKISDRHSLFSNYAYLSIYSSSNIENSFMAVFNWEVHHVENRREYERKYEKLVDESEIFSSQRDSKLSWGTHDKIYRAINGSFEIARFNNYAKKDKDESYFSDIRKIDLASWKGEVIGGGTSYFGTIIECENALVIALSDASNYTIRGPITRWRTYPRSINYENHLHVILEDRIDIYSFNNDYFVNQYEKDFGMFYKKDKKRILRNLYIDL